MKNLMKRIRVKRGASKVKSKSPDPIIAYKAQMEVGIYTWLLDLIAKELDAEKAAVDPVPSVPNVPSVQKIPAT